MSDKSEYTNMQEPKDLCEVFQTINDHQIEALMLHDQMADLFDFLGLMGFKRMHEYQHLSESVSRRGLKRYYLNHHNMLICDGHIENPRVIPEDWSKYTRMDVTPQVRKQAVQRAFARYLDWETKTKTLYETMAKHLMSWGYVADFNKINDLISDVDMELKCLTRMCLRLRSVEYDAMYLVTIQDSLHEEYQKKTKELGVSIC